MSTHDQGSGAGRRTTYKVRIQSIGTRARRNGPPTYRVRWTTDGHEQHETFTTWTLADSFRSELITAARKGEPFEIDKPGLPSSMWDTAPTAAQVSWLDHARDLADMTWQRSAPNTRSVTATSLTYLTMGMLDTEPDTDPRTVRHVLTHWVFNKHARLAGPPADPEHAQIADWLAEHTIPVAALAQPDRLRALLGHVATRLDNGRPVGAFTLRTRRRYLHQALDYATERGILDLNPLPRLRWAPAKDTTASHSVSPKVVINPDQARSLLNAVTEEPRGPHLVAFFALIYYAGLRPAEAADLREGDLKLPDTDGAWGEVVLATSAPYTAPEWSGDPARSGRPSRRESRSLKHRNEDEIREVPLMPALVRHLRTHLDQFGTDDQGRLFRNTRGGPLSTSYGRTWARARTRALSPAQAGSPLARRVYDLRHACVSGWLNAGMAATEVAKLAGHSVNVLLKTYASCIYGQEDTNRRRMAEAFGEQYEPENPKPDDTGGTTGHNREPRA